MTSESFHFFDQLATDLLDTKMRAKEYISTIVFYGLLLFVSLETLSHQ